MTLGGLQTGETPGPGRHRPVAPAPAPARRAPRRTVHPHIHFDEDAQRDAGRHGGRREPPHVVGVVHGDGDGAALGQPHHASQLEGADDRFAIRMSLMPPSAEVSASPSPAQVMLMAPASSRSSAISMQLPFLACGEHRRPPAARVGHAPDVAHELRLVEHQRRGVDLGVEGRDGPIFARGWPCGLGHRHGGTSWDHEDLTTALPAFAVAGHEGQEVRVSTEQGERPPRALWPGYDATDCSMCVAPSGRGDRVAGRQHEPLGRESQLERTAHHVADDKLARRAKSSVSAYEPGSRCVSIICARRSEAGVSR